MTYIYKYVTGYGCEHVAAILRLQVSCESVKFVIARSIGDKAEVTDDMDVIKTEELDEHLYEHYLPEVDKISLISITSADVEPWVLR